MKKKYLIISIVAFVLVLALVIFGVCQCNTENEEGGSTPDTTEAQDGGTDGQTGDNGSESGSEGQSGESGSGSGSGSESQDGGSDNVTEGEGTDGENTEGGDGNESDSGTESQTEVKDEAEFPETDIDMPEF